MKKNIYLFGFLAWFLNVGICWIAALFLHSKKWKTNTLLPLPTPFSQQTIYLFEQIENEVFRCFQLVYLFFFFIFHLDCEGVSDGGTHAHPLTRISDREKKTYKEREKNAAAVSQYSGIYPAACLFSSSLFCFSLCCAFCFITAYRTEDGPTPLSPPSLLPYKDTCGTRGGGRERKRERETSEPRGVGRRDNP